MAKLFAVMDIHFDPKLTLPVIADFIDEATQLGLKQHLPETNDADSMDLDKFINYIDQKFLMLSEFMSNKKSKMEVNYNVKLFIPRGQTFMEESFN